MRRIISVLLSLALAPCLAPAQEKRSGGLFVVIVDDRRGYIDKTGRVVRAPKR